jgi:fatty-acyl-CoA synthase
MSCLCRELKVNRGDNVAILTSNCIDSIVAHFGVPASSGVLVSLNPFLEDAILYRQLEACSAKIIFINQTLIDEREDLLSNVSEDVHIVIIDGEYKHNDNHIVFEHYFRSFSPEKYIGARLDDGVHSEMDPIVMNFTSGTTGRPKGVLYSHRAAYIHSYGQITMFELLADSRYYWSLPMFHVNGWGHMWANVASKTKQYVCLDENQGLEALIQHYGINRLAGSPRLLSTINFNLIDSKIRSSMQMMTGGASPSRELITQAELLNIKIIHQYGLNETCGPIMVSERRDGFTEQSLADKVNAIRRQGVEALHASGSAKVLNNDTHSEVPWDGETIGEIVLTGNTVALGYFGLKESDCGNSFKLDGFYSGDLAVVHENGDIELVDRKKDLIHVDTPYGWENISSTEVEQILLDLDKINDCAVVGYSDSKHGTVVAACVECEKGAISEKDVIKYCQRELPFYKVPSKVFFVNLPKTATGKIRKEALRNLIAENKNVVSTKEYAIDGTLA